MNLKLYNQKTIADGIHTKWAGKTVHFAESVDSTNLWAKRLWREGAPNGTLAVAGYQSAGRGRLGRAWEAPPDTSVMMSILLCPEFAPEFAPMTTLVMGLSVAQAVRALGLPAGIKWPNDAVVSHKKICGILTEMEILGEKIQNVVCGVGINVNIREFPSEMADKATSLYLETGREFDRSLVPGLVMEAFERNYERFEKTCDLSLIRADYEELLANKDQPVRVLAGEDSFEGIARGIAENGELLVERPDGSVCRVNSGEVSVRGLYSYV